MGYHWQCICSHCACTVSHDLRAGGKFFPHIWHNWPRLPIDYTTFMELRLTQMELLAKTVYGSVLKITQRSAQAQNYVSIQPCRKSFSTVVLGDHDFPLITSNFCNLSTFRAIFSHVFTAHVQKRLLMNFRLKFWHHHSLTQISL